MSLYTNNAGINIAEMVFVDFGCNINNTNTSVVKLTMTYDHFKKLHETMGNIIADVDVKLEQKKKAN